MTKLVSAEEAASVSRAALARASVPPAHADLQTDLLVSAELCGKASHGLLRLPRIIERIANGVTNPTASGAHRWRGEAFLEVDGEMGLGPVVAAAALDALCERAARTGVALAAIRNNNHLGMLAWYAERMAARGKISLLFTTSEALVHPWGGRTALVGTNPIAIGVPAEPDPFILDMATSLVSMGRIHDHAHRGEPIPLGWALDAGGDPTTDAQAAKAGAIAPFGGAKGYALAIGIELLVGALTNAALGADVVGTLDSDRPCTKGDVLIVMEPAAGGAAEAIRRYLDDVRACPPSDPARPVVAPGDSSRALRRKREAEGLPVAEEVWSALLRLAR